MIKIPFAYSPEHGRIVEVATVPSGRACHCLCPSCKQAVVAKKGAVNQWHFSHDATPDSGPAEECEISFLVSCRQFIADAAKVGELQDITTPPVAYYGKQYRGSTALKGVQWREGISNFDLTATIGEFQLHLYLSYPGRESPVLPEYRDKSGFLEINLQPIQKAIDHQLRDGRNIIGQAHDLFTSGGGLLIIGFEPYFSARWIYHPLEKHPDVLAEKQRQTEKEERRAAQALDWQLMPAGSGKEHRRLWLGARDFETSASVSSATAKEPLQISERETRYPKGYQGLTDDEKVLVSKHAEEFSQLVSEFQSKGFSEEKAGVKAAIQIMVMKRIEKR